MVKNNSDEDDEINRLAESFGLPCHILVSTELSEKLKPNEFLAGLGIQYFERIKTVLSILKGNMILKDKGEETLPKKAQVIPFLITSGPYITEELISIKAEVTDDGGEKVISLTSILEGD